jgi:hypothetical protein
MLDEMCEIRFARAITGRFREARSRAVAVGTVTVKLPKDLYARLDALAKQERTDVVDLLGRLTASAAASKLPVEPSMIALQRILGRATDLGVSDLAQQSRRGLPAPAAPSGPGKPDG